MIRVTRRYRFSASHRLHSSQLSEEENRRLYGKCANPYGHGHNYVVEISVRGPVDPRSGRAADTGELDRLVSEHVIQAFDHKNLNTQLSRFANVVPTTENLALEIYRRLACHCPALKKVRISETERNIFEVSDETK